MTDIEYRAFLDLFMCSRTRGQLTGKVMATNRHIESWKTSPTTRRRTAATVIGLLPITNLKWSWPDAEPRP